MQVQIEYLLHSLRETTSSDFSALGFLEPLDQRIRCDYVSGNQNEKFKNIVLRPGKGIAGEVLRRRRPFILDASVQDAGMQRMNFPIMLAENLQSAAAVPVRISEEDWGVLLVASRSLRQFLSREIEMLEQSADRLAVLLRAAELKND
ncbi:GAF domain-containing protein [Ferviditalea candida]|uniref:GAF domain-containing protein n=1 Tax=Ferviditalea candida TaxID=3108399 RepID=A0ABU5ZJH3_9BACL|nr:GAF domain-containing protein [Paenibacillaceae bacterium T2]